MLDKKMTHTKTIIVFGVVWIILVLLYASGGFRSNFVDGMASPEYIGVDSISTDIDWYVLEDDGEEDSWLGGHDQSRRDLVFDNSGFSDIEESIEESIPFSVHVERYTPLNSENTRDGCLIEIDRITDSQGNEKAYNATIEVHNGIGKDVIYSKLYKDFVEAAYGSEDSFILVKVFRYIPTPNRMHNIFWFLTLVSVVIDIFLLVADRCGKLKKSLLFLTISAVTAFLVLLCLLTFKYFLMKIG